MFKEYSNYDGIGLADLIRKKQVSVSEVIESAILQAERWNPHINAIVYKRYAEAKAEALSQKLDFPLAGVPFLIKDLGVEVAGTPIRHGSRLSSQKPSQSDSEIVRRFKQAGFITIGKTNTPEFGIMGVTEPELWGPCHNPWNLSLTPGGSSGGSAAAVAARITPIASADDGGGSIRIPASACGLFGFKPSRGLGPMGPSKNESWLSLVSGHVVSRTVRDSALVMDLTKGPALGAPYGPVHGIPEFGAALNSSLKGKKVAFTKQSLFGEKMSPECLEALKVTMRTCEELGMEVIEDQPVFNKDEMLFSYYVIVAASVAGEVARMEKALESKATLQNVEPATWFLKIAGEKLRAFHLEQALYWARQATIIWERFFTKYDFFSTSTMAFAPSAIGLMNVSAVEKLAIQMADYLPLPVILSTLQKIGKRGIEKTPNTSIFNMSGHPAMSVPTHWTSQNIPIGVQFVGQMGRDQELFSVAAQLEKKFNWSHKEPSLPVG